MFQQVTGEKEKDSKRERREREGESGRKGKKKTPFGAEMERIDSVAPSGKRHF